MPKTIQELIGQHRAFYEVMPYYIVVGAKMQKSGQRIHAGFDIDIYGVKESIEQKPGQDYLILYEALQNLVKTLPDIGESCLAEVISFRSTVIVDTRRHFQQEGLLRIRITHKGVDEPAGEPEERALKEIKERLHDLGLKHA